MQTDSDSVQISTDSIGLHAIPHRNGAEYMGESKDLGAEYLNTWEQQPSIYLMVGAGLKKA